MKAHKTLMTVLLALLICSMSTSPAKNTSKRTLETLPRLLAGANSKALMNANNTTSWVSADGYFHWDVSESWNGEFPKSSGIGTIFAEGIVFGGIVQGDGVTPKLRVTGNTYFHGMQPGSILTDASGNVLGAENPSSSAANRVWAVRPDVRPGMTSSQLPDLTIDAATFYQKSASAVTSADIQEIADQYMLDWKEWPAAKGAPWYIDTIGIVRNDAAFDPNNPHHIPGVPGATKTIWFVCNDLSSAVTNQFAGSPPIGMEQQMTLWAYASSTPLNEIIFKQVKLIYKGTPTTPSTAYIDSLYIVQWADGDVGDAGDDYAGCDSLLSLGFQYNATPSDAKYAAKGMAAPAVGYAFLNGVAYYTGNPNDSAVVNFQWRHGYKYFHDRALTAFDYFAAGSPISDPDDKDYNGTLQWFNLMRGYIPRPAYPAGDPFYTASTYASQHGIVTSYCLSGDVASGSGWVDGIDIQAGDRRIVNVHGPVTLKRGDTAEVVIALVQAMGSNNISSVQVLKYNTTFAHYAFNQLFVLPQTPPAPKVAVTELPQKIVLSWGSPESVSKVESYRSGTFVFEGYNVYQLPSPSSPLSEAYRIATYDLQNAVTVIYNNEVDPKTGYIINKPMMFGLNSGIKRSITITQDYLRARPLVNGQPYYYVITAYVYDESKTAPFSYLESPVAGYVLTVVPQDPKPGIVYPKACGDTLDVVHSTTSGAKSDGLVIPIVVRPEELTGHKYAVTFQNTGGVMTWRLYDSTANKVVLDNQTAQTGDPDDFLIVDGMHLIVVGAPNDFKNFFEVANANGPHTPTYAAFAFNNSGFPHPEGVDRPSPNAGGARWGIHTGNVDDASYDYDFFRNRISRNGARWSRIVPYDFEVRFTQNGSKAEELNTGAIIDVPFELWNIGINTPDDPSDDYKMIPVIYDVNGNGVFDLNGHDHPISGGDNDPETDWIYWYTPANTSPGTVGYDAWVSSNFDDNTHMGYEVMARMVFVNFNGGSVSASNFPNNVNQKLPETGTVFRIISTKPNQVTDVFTFTAPAPYFDRTEAQVDVEKINVFPNPYYGVSIKDPNRLNKFVTFNHLPPNATIRIFNLAGVLVKTIKDYTGQFATWNLKNENNLPVASGIYIVHVDMPDLGKSKVLKLAIIQEEQILPTY